MNRRYLHERAALTAREGETVDISSLGVATATVLYVGPTREDFEALAKAAYVRGDLTAEEFEDEVDRSYREAGSQL